MRRAAIHIIATLSLLSVSKIDAAPTTQPQPPVTREEYDRLVREQQETRRELDELRAQRTSRPDTRPTAASSPEDAPVTRADFEDLERDVQRNAEQLHAALPGMEHLVIVGDAAVGFANLRHTDSTFSAVVSPLFLWEPTDRLLFEAAFDIDVSTDTTNSSSTSVNLTIADASYIVNDYLIVGGGLFVVPFGQYHNHFDPPWINKLPDDPLVFSDGGLAPGSEVGVFGRGAVPLGPWKLTYDAYLTNGPNLIVKDPAAAGSLNFADYTDLNNGKAVGGRLGLLPMVGMELGYSVQYSQTAPDDFPHHVYAILQAADFNWVQEVRPIAGQLTLRAEWVWSDLERATYDPRGALGFGPVRFGNFRQGGYAMIAYRPTLVDNAYLRNLEFVFRYDALRSPRAALGGDDEQRYALGVDYWLTPSAVLKFAYEFDHRRSGANQDGFLVQLGIGL